MLCGANRLSYGICAFLSLLAGLSLLVACLVLALLWVNHPFVQHYDMMDVRIPEPHEVLSLYLRSETIPDWALARVQQLDSISVSDGDISFVPQWFGKLHTLRELKFKSCSALTRLPEIFDGLERLEYFSIEQTPIRLLPRSLGNVATLKTLFIADAPVDLAAFNFTGLRTIDTIRLNHVVGLSLHDSIGSLLTLKTLVIFGCAMELRLPASLGDLSSLETLAMMFLDISTVPAFIQSLSSLKLLVLSYNPNLQSMPSDFQLPPRLRELRLSNTPMSSLPDSVSHLPRLEVVAMDMCKNLTRIPDSLQNAKSITDLLFDNSQVRLVPEWVWGMPRLRFLNLYNCPIRKNFIIRITAGEF